MTITTTRGARPHAGQRVHATGLSLGEADLAMILLHGRGASPATS